MEHRWGTRQPGGQRGHLYGKAGIAAPVTIVNMSVSGALLQMAARSPVFGQVRLRLTGTFGVLSIEAQVVRHTRDGCAIEWDTLGEPSVMTLLGSAHARVLENNGHVGQTKSRRKRRH